MRARGSDSDARVVAVVPCHHEPPRLSLLEGIDARVDELAVIDDGVPEPRREALMRSIEATGATLIGDGRNRGKGTALGLALQELGARPDPPESVIVLDADGQHPPDAIPDFLAAAASAELVIGDRSGSAGAIPPLRRVANRTASLLLSLRAGQRVPDSQCGMRLLRGRALAEIRYSAGGYEVETDHLRRCLLAGVRVAWVPIPAIYDGEVSHFRAVRDSVRVLRAIAAR